MNTTVSIFEMSGSPLRRFNVAIERRVADQQIGRAIVKLLQEHFRGLPANGQNFPSTGFWQRAAEATSYELEPEGVRVSVNQTGVRQRLLGGDIKPIRGKFLTIPAIAETYGQNAAQFGGLKMVRVNRADAADKHPALALAPKNSPRDKAGYTDAGAVYFWLVKAVSQSPNPDFLPADDVIRATALEAARAALK